ncbi:hypothetical protein PBI_SCTP2_383 [Salicola phage SCTP-2]|nr:hypothetical protein PBI_SCTP2_383 [Salicola phage SCTP-2]
MSHRSDDEKIKDYINQINNKWYKTEKKENMKEQKENIREGVIVAWICIIVIAILSLTSYLILEDCADGQLIIGNGCKMSDNYGEAFTIAMLMSIVIWIGILIALFYLKLLFINTPRLIICKIKEKRLDKR